MEISYRKKYLKYKTKYILLKKSIKKEDVLSKEQIGGNIDLDFLLGEDLIDNYSRTEALGSVGMFVKNIFKKTFCKNDIEYQEMFQGMKKILSNSNPLFYKKIGLDLISLNKIKNVPDELIDNGDNCIVVNITCNKKNYFNDNKVFDGMYLITNINNESDDCNDKMISLIKNIIFSNPDYNLYIGIGTGISMDYNLPEFIIRDVREHGQKYIILLFEFKFYENGYISLDNFVMPLGTAKITYPDLFSDNKILCYYFITKFPWFENPNFIRILNEIKTTNKNYLYYGVNTCGKILSKAIFGNKVVLVNIFRGLDNYTIFGCDGYISLDKEIIQFSDKFNTNFRVVYQSKGKIISDDENADGINANKLPVDIRYNYIYRTRDIP